LGTCRHAHSLCTYIPRPFAASPSLARRTPSVGVAQGSRILLAEDGPDNQRLITVILQKAGAEVTVAANGQIACDLALAARNMGTPFDVVLMDMQMPILDGYEATRKLRAAGYAGPIIALTAHAMKSDRNKCVEAGCDDYTTKPIDRAHMISLIARALTSCRESGKASPARPVRRERGPA
jgi:CheY-like chemotaxis protein